MHMQLLHNDKVIMFDKTDFGPSNISLPFNRCRYDPNFIVLLIHGLGGIGKTTIAKCIFNSSRDYDGSCLLANITEDSNQRKGLL